MTEPTTREEKIAALEQAIGDETDESRRRDLETQLADLRAGRDADSYGTPQDDPPAEPELEGSASFQSGESSSDRQAQIAELEEAAAAGDVAAGQARNVAPGTSAHTALAALEDDLGGAVRDALAGPHAAQVRRAIAELNHWAPEVVAVLTGTSTDDDEDEVDLERV